MTDDKTPSGADHAATPPSNRSTNRPTTIDLKASEFKTDTQAAGDVPPASDTDAGDTSQSADAHSDRDPAASERRAGSHLATGAIAAAAAAIFFVVGSQND